MNSEQRQKKLRDLLNEFHSGEIQLPQFQRNYVWRATKIRNLLDSLLRRFPIGGFYLQKLPAEASVDPKPKAFRTRTVPSGPLYYLIDGQQRLTGLEAAYGLFSGDDKGATELRCYLDLAAPDLPRARDTRLFVTYGGNKAVAHRVDSGDPTLIPLSSMFDGDNSEIRNDTAEAMRERGWDADRIEGANDRLRWAFEMLEQSVPCTVIADVAESDAVEVFSRLNKGGKALSQGDVKAAELARGKAVEVLKGMRKFVSSPFARRLGFGFSFAFRALVLFHQGSAQFKSLKPTWIEANNRPLSASWSAAALALDEALKFADGMGWSHRNLLPSANSLIVLAAAFEKDGFELSEDEKRLYRRFLCLTALRGSFQAQSETTMNKFYRHIRDARGNAAEALVESLKRNGHKVRADEIDKYAQMWGPATQVMHAWLVSKKAKDWLSGDSIDELARDGSSGVLGGDLTVHHIFPRRLLADLPSLDEANSPANYALLSRQTNSEFKDRPPREVFNKLTLDERKRAEVQFFSGDAAGDRLEVGQYAEFCRWRATQIAESINAWLGLT